MIMTSDKRTDLDTGAIVVTGTVEFQGQTFTAGGGLISEDFLYCYPRADGTVTTWNGPTEGARIIRRTEYRQWNPFTRWRESRTCYRVRLADGRIYFGRNGGNEMLLKAKRARGLEKR